MNTSASWDARAAARPRGARGGVHRATHLFALSAFAIAQPLFAKLGPVPGYFAAHGMTSTEVVLFAVGLAVVPPVVLIAVEAVARVFGRRARWTVHLVLVASLVALTVLPPLGAAPTALAYLVAGLAGIGFAAAYARWRGLRAFTTVLGLAPVLFLAAFLFASPTAKMIAGDQSDAWRAEASFRPPIVVVEFDALPSLLLQTRQHEIDRFRFPSFARLARDSVWYRNASTVAAVSDLSVPSFVDGRLPRRGTAPIVQDHSPNLFTLLGPEYRMNVSEEATNLCPYEFCRYPKEDSGSIWDDTRIVFNQIVRPEGARSKLPPISGRWTDFGAGPPPTSFRTRAKTQAYIRRHLRSGRIVRFDGWLGRIGHGGARPELDYIHVLLPRAPREFLPDGSRYAAGPPSHGGPFLSEQDEQRAILQLGYTDRILGRVIARLKQLGIYRDALLVVTADRGESFGAPGPAAVADTASIPLFVKYPNGDPGHGADDRFVRSVDVLPTIAHALGLRLPPLDGRALQGPRYRGHAGVRVITSRGLVREPVQRWARQRRLLLGRRLSLFGAGAHSVYAFGPHRALVGRPLSDFQLVAPTGAQATLANAKRIDNIDPLDAVCPCLVGGQIKGAEPAGMPLAIALNGRIVAAVAGYAANGTGRLNWSAMIPPSAYEDGQNRLEVYRIAGSRRLEPIGPTSGL